MWQNSPLKSLFGGRLPGWKTAARLAASLPMGLCFFLCSCGDPVSYGNIPDETINFTVYPYSLDNTLMAVGNYKYFPYGYSGVFVYHIGYMDEEFVAFEQACPIDWEDGCYVEFDPESNLLKGTRCHSEFGSFDGFCRTVSGYALKKCRITWTSSQTFQVSN